MRLTKHSRFLIANQENKMIKQFLTLGLLTVFLAFSSCNSRPNDKTLQSNTDSKETVTIETLKQILDAFNRHDPDAIIEYFTDDCSFDFPRGPKPWGQRFVGKAQVREGLAARFKGIPDVHYGEDIHWISAE